MTGTGAINAPAVLETPGGRSHLIERCNVPDRTYAPDAESTSIPHARGLPDDPNMEMELARSRTPGDDEPDSPSPAALFPEIPTWTDERLVVAIELADLREPGLNLYAVGDLPDRHEAFLHECSAELVRRLEERGVAFAA